MSVAWERGGLEYANGTPEKFRRTQTLLGVDCWARALDVFTCQAVSTVRSAVSVAVASPLFGSLDGLGEERWMLKLHVLNASRRGALMAGTSQHARCLESIGRRQTDLGIVEYGLRIGSAGRAVDENWFVQAGELAAIGAVPQTTLVAVGFIFNIHSNGGIGLFSSRRRVTCVLHEETGTALAVRQDVAEGIRNQEQPGVLDLC